MSRDAEPRGFPIGRWNVPTIPLSSLPVTSDKPQKPHKQGPFSLMASAKAAAESPPQASALGYERLVYTVQLGSFDVG